MRGILRKSEIQIVEQNLASANVGEILFATRDYHLAIIEEANVTCRIVAVSVPYIGAST